jgi:hypothetical protein
MEASVDPLSRGPDWMPITPERGSFLHADSHRIAKREVKEGWKRQKIKCSHFEAWELTRAADAYLAEHRATLIEEATETVRTDPLFRTLAERYERKRKGKRQ